MKLISNKKYNTLIEAYAPKYSAITYKEECEILKSKLKEAQDLKSILEKMSSITINGVDWASSGGSFSVHYPENVAVYVDDILGGKVVKQEGIKCLVIDKEGNVKTGLTKNKPDGGYTYKLVRKQ